MRAILIIIALLFTGNAAYAQKLQMFERMTPVDAQYFIATKLFPLADPSKLHFDCNFMSSALENTTYGQRCTTKVGKVEAITSTADKRLFMIALVFDSDAPPALVSGSIQIVLAMYEQTGSVPKAEALSNAKASTKFVLRHLEEQGSNQSFDGTGTISLTRENGKTYFSLYEGD